LEDAVEYCKKNGVEFYAVNKNFPEEVWDQDVARKINADIFIDDRNVGGFIGWSEIWQLLHPEGGKFDHQFKNPESHTNYNRSSASFIKKLFGKK
jgi:hypothetical protein